MIKQKEEDSIKIIPLGGLGAIGNHCTIFEYRDEIIVVDAGIMFPDDEVPGVDFLIPDFSYLEKNKKKVKGIIITHGHEDHIGALPFLLQKLNVPVYAAGLTLGFIKNRLEERPPKETPVLIEIYPRNQVELGHFRLEFIRINHSIVDGIGIAITTDVGTIIHSGDFKIDYSPLDGQVIDLSKFAEYGEKGVLLLMSDSTNALVKGYSKSESSLKEGLTDIFSSARGRIIVASFASHIHRMQQVLDAAYRFNRKVAISGISMEKNFEIAANLNHLNYKKELMIDIREASSLPDKKLVVICTGSQGEPMSALSRMANGIHKHIQIGERDTIVISASVIPGNEKTVNNVINSIMTKGAEVFYDHEDIHASGHAAEEELKLLISLTKPRFFMPIHGEYRHLKAHAKIAESLKIKQSGIIIAKNGDILELNRRGFRQIDSIDLRRVFVDGIDIGDIESDIIRDRQLMSAEGIIFFTAVISGKKDLKSAHITAKGFIGHKNKKLVDTIRASAEADIKNMLKDGNLGEESISKLDKKIKRNIYNLTKRNPLVEIKFIEV
jgi:ribonuclease J